jgi:hypothetical protein
MTLVHEVVEDFDAAVDRIQAAIGDLRLQRRAIREALGHLYTIRTYRRDDQLGEKAYNSKADNCNEGKITRALTELRNLLIHDAIKPVGPAFKDSDVYYDKYADYGLPRWLNTSEMTNPPAHFGHVAGRDVLDTLGEARRFLVEPTLLGRPLV